MSRSLYKTVTVCSLLLFAALSCTKEGLPGPEGEPGPPGENGSGSAPGALNQVISYSTPAGTIFSWEAGTGGLYKLKYTTPSRSGYAITLPDSVTRYIDEGMLLVYADLGSGPAGYNWIPLQAEPIIFYGHATYTYTIERITGTGYRFSFIATGEPHIDYRQLRFVVIPKTSTEEFGD
jgi:hypothetical protein